jgi:hypothetical protein
VEDLGIPDLTSEQIEKLCTTVEEAARRYVLAKVPKKNIERLDVSTEVEGTGPTRLEISIDVGLLPTVQNSDLQKIINEAVKEGFNSAEKYLRELSCHSQK